MLMKTQIIIAALSLGLLLFTLDLIRKKRLREEYALLWLFTVLSTFVFSLAPEFFLAKFLIPITGVYYLSAVVLIIFIFILLIVFHFSVVISRLTDQGRDLTQRYALLMLEFEELKKRSYVSKTSEA
jgi:hypothetical protein